VHVVESTVGRRYAGWFLKNAEHAARVCTQVRSATLPVRQGAPGAAPPAPAKEGREGKEPRERKEGRKVAWGGA
jgi:translation initiation factor 3 subunit L